jgi:hypothetical protein
MADANRTDRVQAAPSRREELLRMKRQLEDLLSGVEAQIRETGSSEVPEPKESSGTGHEEKWTGSKRPVRELVLDSLDELGWPAYTRELTQYCGARFGREIPATRYGPLMKDEMQAFRPGTNRRPVWLCFALTSDRHQAIKRLLCRSNWPLHRRIIAPSSGLVQYLNLTARLCELAMKFESSAADPQMLRIIAADHARDLPGVRLIRGKFDLEGWRSIALQQLHDAAERDEAARKTSAERLEARSELYQLFGMPDVHDGPATEANEQRVGS